MTSDAVRQDSRTSDENCLVLSGVTAVYSNIILALRGVSLVVPTGGMVALPGANGAGKTTTLKAISNLLSVERGKVTEGVIALAKPSLPKPARGQIAE